MPAALDGFKPFKIFNNFSGDVSENSKFMSLHLISSHWDATLDSVKTFGEGGGLDTKFCARLEKKLLKMEKLFVLLKTISFLSSKKCSMLMQL